MMITYIASEKPLVELPGILMTVGLRRIVDGMCVTMSCPELAPPGQHLMITWGTPASCLHHADKAREEEENMQDIFFREVIKDTIFIFVLLVGSIAILILCLYLHHVCTTDQLYKEYGIEVISLNFPAQDYLTNQITSLPLRC